MRIVINNLTSKIVVGGKDNLVKGDILKDLREYLKVRQDGYERTTAYQEGRWDGYKHYLNKKGEFMTGFFIQVYKFCKEAGYSIQVEDNRVDIPEFVEEWSDFVGTIDGVEWFSNDANPKFRRSYQLVAAKSVQRQYRINGVIHNWYRGILNCATNAGKNSITALIHNNLKTPQVSIFMVSNKTIYKQAVEFFSQVIGEPVGEVRSGVWSKGLFNVCMVKTLKNKAIKDLNFRLWLSLIHI